MIDSFVCIHVCITLVQSSSESDDSVTGVKYEGKYKKHRKVVVVSSEDEDCHTGRNQLHSEKDEANDMVCTLPCCIVMFTMAYCMCCRHDYGL